MYEMGAFHFGHFDRGVIVFLADSGPLGLGADQVCLGPVGVA